MYVESRPFSYQPLFATNERTNERTNVILDMILEENVAGCLHITMFVYFVIQCDHHVLEIIFSIIRL